MTPETEKVLNKVDGLYLDRDLQSMAKRAGRMIVIANYVTDLNDVIARKDSDGEFQVAKELKNGSDWRLFQELTAQADAIITGAGYLKRFAKLGEGAENVIDQFSEGGSFEDLGKWRLDHGFKKRNPDIIIVSRSLDFDIPKAVLADGRKVVVFTTYESASVNPRAKKWKGSGIYVIGVGVDGVDGEKMADFLASGKLGPYKVIKMTTGPRVLKILLDGNALDELYITQVQRKIDADPSETQRVLVDGGNVADLPGFKLTESFIQENVLTDDGESVTQKFLVYDKESFIQSVKL